jgi:calcium-dependent protein kinase
MPYIRNFIFNNYLMGNCCFSHNKDNLIVERITLKKRKQDHQIQTVTPVNWLARSKRSSIYMVNNEDILTKYNFEEQVGYGYFGTVKICVPKNDARKKYACKSIDKSKLSPQKINNLIREIETLSMVDHPNIIKYFETYNDPKYFHIIMELCTGGELFDRISHVKQFTEKEACNIIFKIITAILHCHSLGIVHRDLKPENILYENKSDFSDIKIIDFGLSRQTLTAEDLHSIVGSPYYVAPEVLDGNYDKKCDIWSIGILTYCLLSGKPPFMAQDKQELYKKIKTEKPKFKSKVWNSITVEAIDFITLLLNKNPDKRPSARVALQSKWFKQIYQNDLSLKGLDPKILEKLKNFHQPKQFTRIILDFMVKKLNTKEIDELKKAFNILDEDRGGFIEFSELKKAFSFCGIDIKDDEIQAVLNHCNPKWKEKINYTSFIAAALDKKNLLNKDVLWETFRVFDTDQTGSISLLNIEKAIERTGKKKKIGAFQKMFEELGLQSDAQISFEEFCSIIENEM